MSEKPDFMTFRVCMTCGYIADHHAFKTGAGESMCPCCDSEDSDKAVGDLMYARFAHEITIDLAEHVGMIADLIGRFTERDK